jgi:oligopeptide transport system substrate-binding protein
MKKTLSLVLALMMVLALVSGCTTTTESTTTADQTDATGTETAEPVTNDEGTETVEVPSYTFNDYTSALANNWNPHTWETNADDAILGYLSSPFVTMQAEDTENGVYQWVYEMATEINDVTASHQDDLTTYAVNLPEGAAATDITEGYVFEIKLNPDAKWQDGTPINADSYIYSMQQLLNPEMKNYRANLYYAGESAIAGGNGYYYGGSDALTEAAGAYTMDMLTAGEDGQYVTAEGYKVYLAVNYALATQLGGNSLQDYVDAYGDAYFGMDTWEELVALCDENGLVPLTDENYDLFAPVTTGNEAWGETEADLPMYFVYGVPMPEVGFETVGLYKVDDYTINYVMQAQIDYYYALTSFTSTWLVYEDLYEAGKDTTGTLVTTDYGTSVETTMSYGPYKLESFQEDKQMVLVQNENWYGWEEGEDGTLVSYTNYLVDGENVQRYRTTKLVINVMTDDAAKQAFLKGELDNWAPSAEELPTYAASEQLYKALETYTMSFFFNTGLENLQTMDESKGNTNSVVLSNINFRKAFSLSIDRSEWVTATAGYAPTFGLMNTVYYYDFYNDPNSMYRSSEPAMKAICQMYGVEYGDGTPYATLQDAYKSITGYNLTMAKELMATACQELVAAGLYTEGEDIVIRVAYKKGALDSSDNKQLELMNKYINAAVEGSGFGTITLEGLGNINDRYGDVATGEYAIGYGAWGGAALYPFRNFQVYCDNEQYEINEAGCWDPSTENLTLNVNGEDVTMTWTEWSRSMVGTGIFAGESLETKLQITADMEELYLQKYYRIPLASSTSCSLLSYKCSYITPDYNLAYGWGGFELMQYNYTDAEWTEYVSSQNGELSYE